MQVPLAASNRIGKEIIETEHGKSEITFYGNSFIAGNLTDELFFLVFFFGHRSKPYSLTSDKSPSFQRWYAFSTFIHINLWPIFSCCVVFLLSSFLYFNRFFFPSFLHTLEQIQLQYNFSFPFFHFFFQHAGPTGEIVSAADDKEEAVLIAQFDLDKIKSMRHCWGVFRDRRPDLYKVLLTLDGTNPVLWYINILLCKLLYSYAWDTLSLCKLPEHFSLTKKARTSENSKHHLQIPCNLISMWIKGQWANYFDVL